MKKLVLLCFSLLLFARPVKAASHDMKNFLLACAYGTGAGAAVGLLTVAFDDDPDGKLHRVARGASLGLYAGIGFGLYMVYGNPQRASYEDYGFKLQKAEELSPVWVSLKTEKGQLEGAQLNWTLSSF